MSRARAHRAGPAALAALALAACHGEYEPVPPGLRVLGGPLEIAEAGGTATFQVALTTAPQSPVEVDVLSEDATEGALLGPGGGAPGAWLRLRFTASDWDAPQAVTVVAADDATRDGDVAWRVRLAVAASDDAAYAAAPGASLAVTTLDDDTPGIRLSRTALATSETGAKDVFRVSLASQPSDVVAIPVLSGDPSEGLVSGGPRGIAPGASIELVFTPSSWSTPQAVTVTGVRDHRVDGAQSYAVAVGPAATADPGYAALAAGRVTVLNADADVADVIVTPGSLSIREGFGASFSVRLATEPAAPITIPVVCGDPQLAFLTGSGGSTLDGSALTLVFADMSVVHTVNVWTRTDGVVDGPQPLAITVGPATGDPLYAVLPQRSVDVTVVDFDLPGVFARADGSLALVEGGEGAVRVSLQAAPLAAVTVPVATSDASEALVSADGSAPAPSLSLTFTPQDWDVEQRVAVTAVDDALVELDPPHPFTVRVGPTQSASAPYDGVGETAVPGSVADDEVAPDEGTLAAPIDVTGLLPWQGTVGLGSSHYRVAGFPEGGVVRVSGALDLISLAVLEDTPRHATLCAATGPSATAGCALRLPPGGSFVVRVDGGSTRRGATFALDAAPFLLSTDVPRAIPDSEWPGAASRLTLSGVPPGYASIAVFVEIDHGRATDLALFLTPPSGTSMHQLAGCSGSFAGLDYDRTVFFDDAALTYVCSVAPPFAGTFLPATPIPHPAPAEVNGTWTLQVTDRLAGGIGTLVRWGIAAR